MAKSQPGQVAALLQNFDAIDLAAKLEVDYSTVRRWQTCLRLPKRGLLEKLAQATGIKLETLKAARRADRLANRSA